MTKRELLIRDARQDERGAIEALTRRAYAEYATVMKPTAWAGLSGAIDEALNSTAPAERIVAEHDGVLVGSVMLFPPAPDVYSNLEAEADWPELRMLAVAQEVRGQGVGKALVNECIRRAKAAGATALGLHTSDSLVAAISLYENMGFVRVPEYDFQLPGAELVKAYRLDLGDI